MKTPTIPPREMITRHDFNPITWDGLCEGLASYGWEDLSMLPIESWATLFFLLRAVPDDATVFPSGKWATIQHLASLLDAWAHGVVRR